MTVDTRQHMLALRKANATRLARAARQRSLKRHGSSGRFQAYLDAADMVLEIPAEMEKLSVGEFLDWLPLTGPHRVRRILDEVNAAHVGFPIGEHRELRKLTFEQACVLAHVLRERGQGAASAA